MSTFWNQVGFISPSIGAGSPIAVGVPIIARKTPVQAGIADGTPISYSILDGTQTEDGIGVLGNSATTFTRVCQTSTNSNNPISLSGAAQIAFTVIASDLLPLTILAGIATPLANAALVTDGSSVPAFSHALPAAVQVSVGSLGAGTGASASTFWRGDGTWASASPAGQMLTTNNDTNIILSPGGSFTTALVNPASITASWSGTLAVARGGTASGTASGARGNLGAAALGANSDITSLSGLTTPLSVPQGGTGVATLASHGVLYGNVTSAIGAVATNASGTNKFITQVSSGVPAWATVQSADVPPINLASSANGGVVGNLPVTNLNSGSGAAVGSFWQGDGTWAPVTPQGPLGGAIGIWYMDQITTVIPGKLVIPNAASSVPLSTNMTMCPRRQFFSFGNPTFWSLSNVTPVDIPGVAAPDGSLEASRATVGAGAWSILQFLTPTFTASAQYTIGVWARSSTAGAKIKFMKFFGTPVTSSAIPLTSSWARYSFTFTAPDTVNIIGIGTDDGASTAFVADIIDLTCYPGSVDLGSENLAGHMFLRNAGHTSYASGLLTMTAADYGIMQFPPNNYYSSAALSASVCARLETNPDPTTQCYISRVSDDALFIGPAILAGPGIGLGGVNAGSNQFLGQPQGGSGFGLAIGLTLWDQPGDGLAVQGFTWNAVTGVQSSYMNGVQLLTQTTGGMVQNPGYQDLYCNLLFSTDHPGYNTYSSVALWASSITPSQFLSAAKYQQVRASLTGNLLQDIKWFFTIGDQCAAQRFPFIAAQTASPRVRGADYGYPTSLYVTAGNTLPVPASVFDSTFSSDVDEVIAAYNTPIPSGQKMICLVYIGGGDLGTGNVAAVVAALTPKLDAMRTAGIKVVAATLFDRNFPANQTQYNTDRAAYNAIVPTWVGVHADAYVDFGAVANMGANGNHTNTTYFQAPNSFTTVGGIFQTPAGDALLAPSVVTAVNSL